MNFILDHYLKLHHNCTVGGLVLRLEKSRGPSAAKEGERGTKIKRGGVRNSILGKIAGAA